NKSEQAFFIILGDASKELTGKHASELVASYFEIFPSEAPQPIAPLEEPDVLSTSDDILMTGSEESGPSRGFEDSARDRVRKASESLESDEAKRYKSG
ncbi:unnamed protein product, partial [Brassica rapa]